MPGPARAGLLIYAKDPEGLASFYQAVASMERRHATHELIVLESPDLQLLLHRIPEKDADAIVLTSPPQRRERSFLKFFLTVASITDAAAIAARLGGSVDPQQWRGPGFLVNNACDPEGNVFHIRESVASAGAPP